MKDANKTKAQLLSELAKLRRRAAKLEAAEIQHKRAKESLRASEAKYRSLVEQIPASMYIAALDETSSTLYNSPQIEQMVGFTADEWTTDPDLWFSRIHPEDRERVSEQLARTHSTHTPFRCEYRLIARDGHIAWIRDEAVVVRDESGHPVCLQGLLFDITKRKQMEDELARHRARLEELVHVRTAELVAANQRLEKEINERKQAEQALRESEKRYRLLVENVTDVIWTTDLDLRFTDVTPSITALLGYSAQESMSNTIANILTPPSLQVVAQVIAEETAPEKLQNNRDAFWWRMLELEHICKDGSTLWAEVKVSFLRDENGAPVGILGVTRDITARKLAQEALVRRAREMTALYETSLEINAQLDVSTLLQAIVRRAADLLGARMGGLYLMEPDNETLKQVVNYNLPGHYIGVTLRLGEGLSGRIAQTGLPMMVADYRNWEGRAQVYANATFRRVVGVPLKRKGQVIGVINVTDDVKTGQFSENEVRLVSLFADQAAIAIENARLYQAAQRELAERKQAEAAEREQRALAEALRDTAAALTSTLSLDQVLERILAEAGCVVSHDAGNIMLIEQDVACIARSQGYAGRGLAEWILTMRCPLAQTANLRYMFETGQPMAIPDVQSYPGWVDIPETRWVHSYVGAPIRIKGQVVGFLNLDSATPGFFDQAHAERLQAFADQAGIAIENARLFEAERQRRQELEAIYQASLSLTASLELPEVLEAILSAVLNLIPAQNAHMFLYADRRLTFGAARTPAGKMAAPFSEPRSNGLTYCVADSGQAVVIQDTRQHPLYADAPAEWPPRAIIGLPLKIASTVVGVMNVAFAEPRHFSESMLRLLDSLAAQAAIAIQNARLYEAVQRELAERKRVEEALRQSNAELQARNEELDAFAHTAAHDLKAPLGLLTGFAEVLEMDYAALSDKERQRSCHHIAQNARKMGNIIDELLLLAGVRKLDVEIAPVDMASIVAEARQHVSDLVKTHRAEIVLPDAWPPASGHAPWIEEVWANYVSNAIKYGGRPPRVELGADTLPGGMVRFWVRDNGEGLTPEDQACLFTPFARLDPARAKGHGLGLSIVRRIVEKLGGQVGVESDGAPGRGSVFYFTLPGVK